MLHREHKLWRHQNWCNYYGQITLWKPLFAGTNVCTKSCETRAIKLRAKFQKQYLKMEINWIQNSNGYNTRCDTFHSPLQRRPVRGFFDILRLIVISEVGNIYLLERTQYPSELILVYWHWCVRMTLVSYYIFIVLINVKWGIPNWPDRTCLCSRNFVGMLPRDVQFDSRLGHRLSWLICLWFASHPSKCTLRYPDQSTATSIQIHHPSIKLFQILCDSAFVSHATIWCCMLYALKMA
jgi:hypothetical protein